jgi:LytS/YehU family sensor histidine kinase
MTKESLKKQENMSDSLFELNTLILDLRSKLSKSLQEVLQLRKDLDLEKEEHQLTQLKYESIKQNLDIVLRHPSRLFSLELPHFRLQHTFLLESACHKLLSQ